MIRNDARPHRWVALELNKRAWGLFWAGGGLQRCRELLADQVSEAAACTALVPATTEALLWLMHGLEPEVHADDGPKRWREPVPSGTRLPWLERNPWSLLAWTSLAWMAVLGFTVAGFLGALERHGLKLDVLLERSQATSRPADRAGSAP